MSNEVDRTLWAGNLSEKISENILYELFLQAGPLERVKIATEKDGRKKNFAFITFSHDASVPYTIQLMDGTPLLGRNLKLQSRPGSVHQQQHQQPALQQHQPPYMNTGTQQPGSPMGNPYINNMPIQMNANPYMMNQPIGALGVSQITPPHFHRSNTWHGAEPDREHRDRSRDRDRYSTRDRSGRRDDYNHRGAGSGYHDNGRDEDFEAKRQRVLQKQAEVSSRYSQNQYLQSSSPQHSSHKGYSNRRGRY